MAKITTDNYKGELVKMVTQKWVARVVLAVEEAIDVSFKQDLVLRPVKTRDEVKRRFNFCMEGFVLMRREYQWAVPKILDSLPVYLRHKLDGTDWKPHDRMWAANETGLESITIDDESPDLNDSDRGETNLI